MTARQRIKVPDVTQPTGKTLCWKQSRRTMERCDREHGHTGPHLWELTQEIADLRLEKLAAEMRSHAQDIRKGR